MTGNGLQMRRVFYGILAIIEMAGSRLHGQGFFSSLFEGLREHAPQNGFFAIVTSSPFIAAGLCLPILADSELRQRFREIVVIPWCPIIVTRDNRLRLRIASGITLVAAALALEQTISLVFFRPLDFAGSGAPLLLLTCAFGVLFCLGNIPADSEVVIPVGTSIEPLGEDNEQIVYCVPPESVAFHQDSLFSRNFLRVIHGPRLALKRIGERVLIVRRNAVFATGFQETLTAGQIQLDLRIDIMTSRRPEALAETMPEAITGHDQDQAGYRASVTHLTSSRMRSDIVESEAYQRIETDARNWILLGTMRPDADPTLMRDHIGNLERLQLSICENVLQVTHDFWQSELSERYALQGGLFYLRVVVKEISLTEEAKLRFENVRVDLRDTMIEFARRNSQYRQDIAALLISLEKFDIGRSKLYRLIDEIEGPSDSAGRPTAIAAPRTPEPAIPSDVSSPLPSLPARGQLPVGTGGDAPLYFGERN